MQTIVFDMRGTLRYQCLRYPELTVFTEKKLKCAALSVLYKSRNT